MVSRRSFLKALAGGAVALSAGGIALLEAEPIVKTYFLPPQCGWNRGSWELVLAEEALRIVSDKLGIETFGHVYNRPLGFQVVTAADRALLESLVARRKRLLERVDKLARGWTPHYSSRTLYAADGKPFTTRIHGGRS